MAEYYDCTMTAGYYKLGSSSSSSSSSSGSSAGGVGEHTFNMAQYKGELYAFPCFGAFALQNDPDLLALLKFKLETLGLVYPAELWSPWMIGSKPQGKSLPANMYVAMGLAQFTPLPPKNPAFDPKGPPDYRVESWKNWWRSLPEKEQGYSSECNAGLTYAVTGVCQQASNRILWATRQDQFTYTPVNWPPSFSATYWVYGYYGKLTQAVAIALAGHLIHNAKRQAIGGVSFEVDSDEMKALKKVGNDAKKASLQKTRKALVNGVPARTRKQEVKKMLAAAPETSLVIDSKKLGGILAPDEKFNTLKTELDKQLVRGEVSHDEYAAQVNGAFGHMLQEFRNILPPETFKTMFRDVPESGPVEIIARKDMPESYEPVREALRI